MPLHTEAERKKRKKQLQNIFRRLAPGQLGKDLLGKTNKKLKDVGKKK